MTWIICQTLFCQNVEIENSPNFNIIKVSRYTVQHSNMISKLYYITLSTYLLCYSIMYCTQGSDLTSYYKYNIDANIAQGKAKCCISTFHINGVVFCIYICSTHSMQCFSLLMFVNQVLGICTFPLMGS